MPEQIRIVKKSILIMSLTKKGLLFEMANQDGYQNINGRTLPKFDYVNKVIFSFSDYEAAQIVREIEKQFLSGGYENKLTFKHLTTEEPKNIILNFSLYKNNVQCGISIFVQNKENKNVQMYLDEAEIEMLKENLKKQYILHFKDDMSFKSYIASKI